MPWIWTCLKSMACLTSYALQLNYSQSILHDSPTNMCMLTMCRSTIWADTLIILPTSFMMQLKMEEQFLFIARPVFLGLFHWSWHILSSTVTSAFTTLIRWSKVEDPRPTRIRDLLISSSNTRIGYIPQKTEQASLINTDMSSHLRDTLAIQLTFQQQDTLITTPRCTKDRDRWFSHQTASNRDWVALM